MFVLYLLQEYYFYNRHSEPIVYMEKSGFMLTLFSTGLAIGVTIAVGMLFYMQVRIQILYFARYRR